MKVYLIRHGETNLNSKRLLQGGTDIPLNEKGILLATITAKGLADVAFDHIYTSPLSRAKQTAELICAGRNIPMTEEARIREISFGPYEGLCCAPDGYNIPDPQFLNFFKAPDAYLPPKGGESFRDLCARTADFLAELAANPALQDKTILVSSHGAAIKSMLCGILHRDLRDFWGGSVHKNCAVTILELTPDGFVVLDENIIYYDEALSSNYFDAK